MRRWKQERLSLLVRCVCARANKFDIMYALHALFGQFERKRHDHGLLLLLLHGCALYESSLWCRRRKFLQTPCRKLPLSNCASIADCRDGYSIPLSYFALRWEQKIAQNVTYRLGSKFGWMGTDFCMWIYDYRIILGFPCAAQRKYKTIKWEWKVSALFAVCYYMEKALSGKICTPFFHLILEIIETFFDIFNGYLIRSICKATNYGKLYEQHVK